MTATKLRIGINSVLDFRNRRVVVEQIVEILRVFSSDIESSAPPRDYLEQRHADGRGNANVYWRVVLDANQIAMLVGFLEAENTHDRFAIRRPGDVGIRIRYLTERDDVHRDAARRE